MRTVTGNQDDGQAGYISIRSPSRLTDSRRVDTVPHSRSGDLIYALHRLFEQLNWCFNPLEHSLSLCTLPTAIQTFLVACLR